ncbi:LuxR C-terminal-related transcriptional regulator [Burkholderia sp. AU30198]|uniref:LuxR C-terminal-related transcriptional regulator n=1 Tax=Burkholderia sp. AU30198 TaxID=2879627 RepID=UPI001CF5D39F|nr:LuxR C-terminal-related transcriptional regulator [Burkholderia sp. AU30198]MCA8299230.1 LuxR C-terminal-related transcriptional regulator [Burkholderia sp. AU30198]
MTSAAIARSMGLKTPTVDTYARRAFAKLGVDSCQPVARASISAPPHNDPTIYWFP